jgi:hypothetical protein
MAQERKSIMEVVKPPEFIVRRDPKLPQPKPLGEFERDMNMLVQAEADRKVTVPAAKKVSADLQKVQQLLTNGITHAHEDTCIALDKVVNEAQQLFSRISSAADHHKNMLRREGQEMARKLEGAVLELRRTVEWVEQQCPKLHEPEDIPYPLKASAAVSSPAPSSADFEPSDYEDNPQP